MDGTVPPWRPDMVRQRTADASPAEVERRRPVLERAGDNVAIRRLLILVVLAACWQGYAYVLNNELLVPSFAATVEALWAAIVSGELPARVVNSLGTLLVGYALGLLISALLTGFAVSSRIGTDFLSTLTAMFNPLPAIALLPLALLWFGLGAPSLLFVLLHSVVWPVSLNTFSGFQSVAPTLRMAGRNYGLRGFRYVTLILVPAAFPAILTGLKIGWAFAWRTLIAAELVFGSNSGGGGLGWYIFQNRNELEIPSVFAGLLAVILIGLLVEGVVFRTIEAATVRRWGMQS